MKKIFLPITIGLLTAITAFTVFSSINLIQGMNQKKHTDIKGVNTSTTSNPTPTTILTPTLEAKTESNTTRYIPSHIPTIEPTATPTVQKPDNTAKLNAIANQFKKIADLNTQIVTYQILANDAANSYTCDPNDYAHIFNPSERDALYQQCLSGQSSTVGSYTYKIEGLKNQIKDINNQIQGIIATCSGNECNDYYWELASGFEAQGYIVK